MKPSKVLTSIAIALFHATSVFACDVDAIMVDGDSIASRNNLLSCISDLQQQQVKNAETIIALDQQLRLLRAQQTTTESIVTSYLSRRWTNKSRDRKIDTAYRNNTQNPIEISVTMAGGGTGQNSNSCDLQVIIDSNRMLRDRDNWRDTARLCTANFTVPIGSVYQVNADAFGSNSGRIIYWFELS